MDSKSESASGGISRAEHRRNWPEKRVELLARLDLQASTVLDFNSALQEIPQDSTPDEISEKVFTIEKDVRSKFTVFEIVDSMKVLVGLRELDREVVGGKKKEAAKRISLRQEISELQTNPNVKFLVDIQSIGRSLRRKAVKVAQMKDEYMTDKDKFFDSFLPDGAAADSVSEVTFLPFEVRFFMKKIDVSGEPKLGGFHVPEPPMSFIEEGSFSEDSARHESLHNILDGSLELEHRRNIFTLVDLVRIVHKDDPPDVVIKEVLELIKSPYLELDNVRNEFMAQFDEAFKNGFFTGIKKDPFAYDSEKEFREGILSSLSTAGHDITEVKKSFLRFADNINDAEAQEKIRNYVTAIDGAVLKTLHFLNDSFEIAKRLEDESAVDYLRAACFVLKPSQYRHLESYLEYKYGETKIMDIKKSMNIARELNPSLESLEYVEVALARNEILDLDKEIIKSKLLDFESIFYDNEDKKFAFHSMSDLRKFVTKYKKIASEVGIEQNELEEETENLMFSSLLGTFRSFSFDGNDKLMDLYSDLEESEKEPFYKAFKEWISNDIGQVLADSDREIELARTDVVNIATDLGLKEELQKKLDWVSRVRNDN